MHLDILQSYFEWWNKLIAWAMSVYRWEIFVYSAKISNFEELLEKDGSVSIHHQNIRFLASEMCEVFIDISPQIVKGIFQLRDTVPYQLKKQKDFQIPSVHSAFSSTEGVKFLGSKNWKILLHEIKNLRALKKESNKAMETKFMYMKSI